MKKLLSVMLGLVLVISLVACSTNKDAGKDDKTPGSGDSQNGTGSGDEEKTIYVIVKVLGNQYWSVVQAGAEKAGEELGCKVVIVGTAAESDIEGQVRYLQDAVSAKADAIVIAPLDRTALKNPISEQFKSGTPIVLIDSNVDGEDYSTALMTDNIEAGRMAAKELLEKLNAKGISQDQAGSIAIQAGSTGSQAINDRLQGFNEYWSANAPAAWKVLNDDIKINDGDISKAVAFCQDFLITYPDLLGVFGPNNGSTVGFVTGLTEAGRTDISMVGFDFSAEIEAMIRGGKFDVSSVLQRQYLMGYDGVKTALELSNGGTVSDKTIDTGVIIVDSENVDSAEIQDIINP